MVTDLAAQHYRGSDLVHGDNLSVGVVDAL
jgi:hypothetical protein